MTNHILLIAERSMIFFDRIITRSLLAKLFCLKKQKREMDEKKGKKRTDEKKKTERRSCQAVLGNAQVRLCALCGLEKTLAHKNANCKHKRIEHIIRLAALLLMLAVLVVSVM